MVTKLEQAASRYVAAGHSLGTTRVSLKFWTDAANRAKAEGRKPSQDTLQRIADREASVIRCEARYQEAKDNLRTAASAYVVNGDEEAVKATK